MNQKPKTKLLTISLLCCGRPETTERCLKSLMPIRKAIKSEIQVVDTGCSPETRAVIEQYADEVFEFTWCDDFSAARNFQLEQANGEWFLFIDDDEFFEDCKDIISFFKTKGYQGPKYGVYYVRNYSKFDGTQWHDSHAHRMVRVSPQTEFIGRIHEHFKAEDGDTCLFSSYAGHYGYCFHSAEERDAHSERNRSLLELEVKDHPDQLYAVCMLACQYFSDGMGEELKELADRYLKRIEAGEEIEEFRIYGGSIWCAKMDAEYMLEHTEEVKSCYEKLIEIAANPMVIAKASYVGAKTFFREQDYDKALEACNYFLEVYEKIYHDKAAQYENGMVYLTDAFLPEVCNYIFCIKISIELSKGRPEYLKLHRNLILDLPQIRMELPYVYSIVNVACNNPGLPYMKEALEDFAGNEGLESLLFDVIEAELKESEAWQAGNLLDYFEGREAWQNRLRILWGRLSNPAQFRKMQELEQSILAKYDSFQAAGHEEEAKSLKRQVEEILMNTYGVRTLVG